VVPCPKDDTMPPVVMLATLGDEEAHVTVSVTLFVVPSAKVSVAVNCCELPSGIVGVCGLTARPTTLVEPGELLLPHPVKPSASAATKIHDNSRNNSSSPTPDGCS
jgi:hypothetical protein